MAPGFPYGGGQTPAIRGLEHGWTTAPLLLPYQPRPEPVVPLPRSTLLAWVERAT